MWLNVAPEISHRRWGKTTPKTSDPWSGVTLFPWCCARPDKSGKKKEHKPKLLGPDFFLVGWGSSTWKGGGQKVWYVPWSPEKPNFRDIPGFLPGYPRGCTKSLRKTLCSLLFPSNEESYEKILLSEGGRAKKTSLKTEHPAEMTTFNDRVSHESKKLEASRDVVQRTSSKQMWSCK